MRNIHSAHTCNAPRAPETLTASPNITNTLKSPERRWTHSHHSAREDALAAPEAAAAAPAASVGSPVMWAATLQRLVDVGGVIEVPVAAESARSEGTVRV